MSDLTTFLLARLAEDEAACHALELEHGAADWSIPPDVERHLERFLADVQAKRNLIAGHPCEDDELGPCDDLRYMGEVYADHPDYREEWRP